MNRILIDANESKGTINPNIYGHFSEHIGGVFYDGIWVGEDSPVDNVRGLRKALVDSFRKINPPVLRWPGGCFAETYDWRDGIGPRSSRPTRANWWYSHDRRTESNQVGTHEFIDFCRLAGAEPYFAANMTSVPPLHIRNWIEYCNFPANTTTLAKERETNGSTDPFNVRYWGIGNENWGGGGQMTPEMCMREYTRFSTVCNSLDKDNLRFILCGANGHDVDWTRRIMKEWSKSSYHEAPTYGMSLHYYCGTAGDPVAFTEDEWDRQLFQANEMQKILDDHRAAMDEFDPERKIGLIVDEWGCWHKDGSGPSKGANLFEQQSSMRDAVVAAMTLNAFNNRCDSVIMANVAQLCNNLHSLYLAAGSDFVETPNYFVFDMYKTHMGARQMVVINECGDMTREGYAPMDRLSVSSSMRLDGSVTITLANMSMMEEMEASLCGVGLQLDGDAEITILSNDDVHAHNSFENPRMVQPSKTACVFHDGDILQVPAGGIVSIVIHPVKQSG